MGLRSEEQQHLAELHREHVLSMMPVLCDETTYAYRFYFPELEDTPNGPVRALLHTLDPRGMPSCPTSPLLGRMEHMLDRFGD